MRKLVVRRFRAVFDGLDVTPVLTALKRLTTNRSRGRHD
jgi:hypothetical protein